MKVQGAIVVTQMLALARAVHHISSFAKGFYVISKALSNDLSSLRTDLVFTRSF